jgi:tripartite-type tricarboxylate transporter receptor subunit TctC
MRIKNLTFLLSLGLFCCLAMGQEYPQKTVKLISPIPAGGAPDLIARAVGQRLSVLWSQPVVIENKIGSNGQVAADFVAHMPADGYTLLVGMDSLFVINPYLYKQTTIDVNRDLIPIATLGSNQFVLTLNPNLPVKS